MSVTYNYSRRTTTTTTIQGSSAWLCLHTLEMLSMTPAAPDQCSPWLRWLQLPVWYWSKMRLRRWNCHSDSLDILHFLSQQCVAPCFVKQTPTKAVARPWTEVNKRSLICAIPPSPSTWRLAVCEHNNILSGQTWKNLNPFTRGDLTTSCSPLWQVNESKAWSSAEASSGPVSLNLGGGTPPPSPPEPSHPSPRGSGLSQ